MQNQRKFRRKFKPFLFIFADDTVTLVYSFLVGRDTMSFLVNCISLIRFSMRLWYSFFMLVLNTAQVISLPTQRWTPTCIIQPGYESIGPSNCWFKHNIFANKIDEAFQLRNSRRLQRYIWRKTLLKQATISIAKYYCCR